MGKLYMVGNTHFDPVWLWTWDEAMASIRATFRSALDRMKEYPDFKYSFSTPPVFDWIKKTDPKMFEEIKQRVKEGRWDIAEAWWDQPDCWSASGESYVRQGLYGQKYLMDNFGKMSDSLFNTDSFGHPNTFPQILAKSGIKYYCMCRPEGRHIPLDSPFFKWQSKDKSSVLVYRIGGKKEEGWRKDIENAMEEENINGFDSMIVFGVTDHGGAPTKKAIEAIMKNDNAVFSSVSEYFEKQENGEPIVVNDELITGDFGVYINNPEIKSMNRRAEYALLNAEKVSIIAKNNVKDKIDECWKDVMFNQFHDILGGASINDAYIDAKNLYGRALQTANEIVAFGLHNVTAQMKMPGKNPDNVWNIVLWNLNGFEYDGYVEAETQWAHEFEWYEDGITLEDDNGEVVETQIITEKSVIPRFRSRFVFKTKVPAFGYRAFKVIRNNKKVSKGTIPEILETSKYIFDISKKDGSIESVFDKAQNKVIYKNIVKPACYEDDGDTWFFNQTSFGKKFEDFKFEKAELVEGGEILTKIKVTSRYRDSILWTYYTFYNNENYFDVESKINFNEEHTVFKFDFENNCEKINVAVPYGSEERGKSPLDRPMGEWLQCGDMLIVSKNNFSYNFDNQKLGLSVLRSAVCGDFRLGELPVRDLPIMSQGITECAFRVFLTSKDVNNTKEGIKFNNTPFVICESNHDGRTDIIKSYASLKSKNAVLTALKEAEKGDSLVFRIVNDSEMGEEATLTVCDKDYNIQIEPYEIKTVVLSKDKLIDTNLLEEKM